MVTEDDREDTDGEEREGRQRELKVGEGDLAREDLRVSASLCEACALERERAVRAQVV